MPKQILLLLSHTRFEFNSRGMLNGNQTIHSAVNRGRIGFLRPLSGGPAPIALVGDRGHTTTWPQTGECVEREGHPRATPPPRWLLCGQDICIVIIIITVYRCGPSAVGSAPGQCMYKRVPPPFIGKKISQRSTCSNPVERNLFPPFYSVWAQIGKIYRAPMTESDLDVHVTKS